jgi:predicted metalloprotease
MGRQTYQIERMQFGNSDQDRSNVEDRRGSILSGTGGRLGLGGIIVLGILSLVFKQNLFDVVQGNPGATTTQAPSEQVAERQAAEKPLERIAVGTFNDAQKFWGSSMSGRYRDAKLVLFWDETRSGCGEASSQTGPFYCPTDERVYIDLGFYRELARRFGAPGDFAQAYVIAHEVGHHVQNLLGLSERVQRLAQRDPSQRNALSVRLELQADCYAGVWGHSAAQRKMLEPGDVEEGLRAAAAVGDDRLQQMAGRRVAPESFTHGSAADRSRWFRRGFDRGTADQCDTFSER